MTPGNIQLKEIRLYLQEYGTILTRGTQLCLASQHIRSNCISLQEAGQLAGKHTETHTALGV